jgi:hypothetical protein
MSRARKSVGRGNDQVHFAMTETSKDQLAILFPTLQGIGVVEQVYPQS